VCFPVRIRARNGHGSFAEVQAQALNISEGGMLVEVPRGKIRGSELLAEFRLPTRVLDNSRVLRLEAPVQVVRREAGENGFDFRLALSFHPDLQQSLRRPNWGRCVMAGFLVAAVSLVLITFLKIHAIENFWYRVAFGVYGLVVTSYILSRFAISAFYRAPRDTGYRPSVSVVVAAKDEEKAIATTLEKIFESDYPSDRLEVIAIDDGSTDRTYDELLRVERRHPDLKLIRFEKNQGKRHGMAAGAQAATGEILVYIDSDSFVEEDTIHRLVQGFADPDVGAVCAHGLVANAWTNTLTRMQAVQYYIAFRVLKAAESVYSSVTCCSGCCAAYRRRAVMAVLDSWLGQTFLGRPATFGDDRSLTNRMLRKYRVIYDETARVSTVVPETFRQFFKQQVRWKKSWLRENAVAASFMWKRPPVMALSFYVGFLFPLFAPIVVGRALFYLPIFEGRTNHYYLLGVFLISLIYGAFYLTRQRNRLWIYAPLLCFFYAMVVSWQLPWAILTSWNNKWGTR